MVRSWTKDQDRINWNLGKREKPNVTFGPGIWFGWVGMIVLLAGGIALGKLSNRKVDFDSTGSKSKTTGSYFKFQLFHQGSFKDAIIHCKFLARI